MKGNIIESKKEKLNLNSKNSNLLSTKLLFNRTIKLEKNPKTSTSREKKNNNKIEKTSPYKDKKDKQKKNKLNDKKDISKISENNLLRSSEKMNLLFIDKIFEQKKQYISKHNSNNNIENKINSIHTNKFKNSLNTKLISFKEHPNYKMKTYDTSSTEKSKKKKYKIDNIFNYPIKYINNNINFNNYITNNKVNYLGNLDIIERGSFNFTNKEKKLKKKDDNINKNNLTKKINEKQKKNIYKDKPNKNVKNNKNNKNKLLNEILNKEEIIENNDTEVKYINNDNEEITESNFEKETEKKLINDELDKCFKIVDTLNNEDEYEGDNFLNRHYFDINENTNISFDDELSSISSQPKKDINKNKKRNKKIIKQLSKNKKKKRIKSPTKLEIKQDNKIDNKEIKFKEKYETNINSTKVINNKKKKDKSIKQIKLKKKSIISDKFKVQKSEESTFNSLLDNKTFKKFLKNKIKYNEIPKKFLNSLSLTKEKKLKHKRTKNLENYDNHFLTTEGFFESSKSDIKISKNIIIEDYDEKDYFDKNNDTSLIYNINYEKLENDNLKKTKEIQNLKEELKNQKIINNEKKELINELQSINHNLEKQVNNLKYKYYLEKSMKKYNNLSNLNLNKDNKIYDFFLNKYLIKNNLKYKELDFREEINSQGNNLNYDELIQKKNILIQIRNEINDKYFNLSDGKENQKYKNMLENKLEKINNSLLKIRTSLNNFKY